MLALNLLAPSKQLLMKNLSSTLIISAVYLLFVTLLMNSGLARDTFLGNYGLGYKAQILISLLQGMWTSMTGTGFAILIITSVLTGANLSLLLEKIKDLRDQGPLRLVVGGSSILGIVSSGCAACGLPILALLGIGGSLGALGFGLSYLAVFMLLISFYLLLKTKTKQVCKI